MLDTSSTFGNIENANITCPCCKNTNTNDMFDVENTKFQLWNSKRHVNHNAIPIVCGKCGTVFVKSYDLEKLHS